MARARLYGWNGERPAKAPTGQKQIVLSGLTSEPDAMLTGKGWAEKIGPNLATRQDPYRVVLYYILGLKSEGCVRTAEREIDAVTKTADGSHAVAITTESKVQEVAAIPSDEAEVDAANEHDEETDSDEHDEETDSDEVDAEFENA